MPGCRILLRAIFLSPSLLGLAKHRQVPDLDLRASLFQEDTVFYLPGHANIVDIAAVHIDTAQPATKISVAQLECSGHSHNTRITFYLCRAIVQLEIGTYPLRRGRW